MDQLEKELKDLENKTSVLDPSEDQRHEIMQMLTDYADWLIKGLDERKVYEHKTDLNAQKLQIGTQPLNMKAILDTYKSEVNAYGIDNASGGQMGFIPNGGIFSAAVGDFMAAISNEFSAIFFGSPGAASIENELLNWMKEMFGYPQNAIGNLTSGASTGTLIALLAARNRHKVKGSLIEKSVVYMTSHTHNCVLKALKIIGLEDVKVCYVTMNERFQMDVNDLKMNVESDIKKGLYPFVIIGNAGTTDTGAVDPLNEMGKIAKES